MYQMQNKPLHALTVLGCVVFHIGGQHVPLELLCFLSILSTDNPKLPGDDESQW